MALRPLSVIRPTPDLHARLQAAARWLRGERAHARAQWLPGSLDLRWRPSLLEPAWSIGWQRLLLAGGALAESPQFLLQAGQRALELGMGCAWIISARDERSESALLTRRALSLGRAACALGPHEPLYSQRLPAGARLSAPGALAYHLDQGGLALDTWGMEDEWHPRESPAAWRAAQDQLALLSQAAARAQKPFLALISLPMIHEGMLDALGQLFEAMRARAPKGSRIALARSLYRPVARDEAPLGRMEWFDHAWFGPLQLGPASCAFENLLREPCAKNLPQPWLRALRPLIESGRFAALREMQGLWLTNHEQASEELSESGEPKASWVDPRPMGLPFGERLRTGLIEAHELTSGASIAALWERSLIEQTLIEAPCPLRASRPSPGKARL